MRIVIHRPVIALDIDERLQRFFLAEHRPQTFEEEEDRHQRAVGEAQRIAERIGRAVQIGVEPAHAFDHFAHGARHEVLVAGARIDLVEEIAHRLHHIDFADARQQAYLRPRHRVGGQKRRALALLLEIFADHIGFGDHVIAVDQRRHLVHRRQRGELGLHRVVRYRQQLDIEALCIDGDPAAPRIGRQLCVVHLHVKEPFSVSPSGQADGRPGSPAPAIPSYQRFPLIPSVPRRRRIIRRLRGPCPCTS